ncbi:MAG TPA: helix-turn-helix transcriptional regulator [Pirellulaceae bacterium]|nr:helix-turn-helix transcriptional regulator [Pirellulaceae bacterium]
MATAELSETCFPMTTGIAPTPASAGKRLHRIRTVRRLQGVSLRSAARQIGVDVRRLRAQEQESNDLHLSDLLKWQKALDVPMSELLVEPDTQLSGPIMERARMIRLMKTAAAIMERASSTSIRRMAQMLIDQLTEIMPELQHVGPWHSVGQRRSLNELGRIVEKSISTDHLPSSFQHD